MLGGSGSTETAPELCEVSLNLQYPKSWTCSPLDLTKDLADKMSFPYDIGTPRLGSGVMCVQNLLQVALTLKVQSRHAPANLDLRRNFYFTQSD